MTKVGITCLLICINLATSVGIFIAFISMIPIHFLLQSLMTVVLIHTASKERMESVRHIRLMRIHDPTITTEEQPLQSTQSPQELQIKSILSIIMNVEEAILL